MSNADFQTASAYGLRAVYGPQTALEPDRLTPQEHRLLCEGLVPLHCLSNAAPGTDGWVVHQLWRRDLMGLEQITRAPGGWVSHYATTPKGRAERDTYGAPLVPITPESPSPSASEQSSPGAH